MVVVVVNTTPAAVSPTAAVEEAAGVTSSKVAVEEAGPRPNKNPTRPAFAYDNVNERIDSPPNR